MPSMKVTSIRTTPYWYRTDRPFADVNFPEGRSEWSGLAVFVDTDEGLTGVSIGGNAAGIEALAPLVVGRDPSGVRGIWKSMVDQVFKGGNRGAITGAIAAIDVALWDLKAKAAGQPLWKMLGASVPRVRAYASDIGYCLSDDELRAFYARMAARGVTAGKLKGGMDPDRDIRRLRIMYEELAKAVPAGRGGSTERPTAAPIEPLICIDANEYWNAKQAIPYIRTLERAVPLFWVEEPADRWDYEGLANVSRAVEAQVATGENLNDPKEIVPLLTHGAVDVVQPNVGHSGITGMLMIADLAYGFNIPVAVMNSPGNYLAHVAASMPNHLMIEVVDAGRDNWFKVDCRIEDGEVVLGDRPGLGWETDLHKLSELSQPPEHRDAFNFGRRKGAGILIHGENR
ncbi:MAG: mandelate racemase/muconate lactonizing enzyme family protein [Spirochaetaceae bacterium]|nr:MAG: mandelate racemase/muconate lactonizing enzyme family protein [Spirochaetaceae bacterium]